MPDCSPTKWHRAHTTWFFETFILVPRGYPAFDTRWGFLFNSYYESLGPRHARPKRGLLSRPSSEQIGEYRRVVDERMTQLLASAEEPLLKELRPLVELGIAHEEQHQELILTDILHALSVHPLRPAYRAAVPAPRAETATSDLRFCQYDGGLCTLGAPSGADFRFDNEEPLHRVWVEPFELAQRLVTVGEWKAFKAEGGYERASLWLSEGFDWVRTEGIGAPLYVEQEARRATNEPTRTYGFDGLRESSDADPLVHVSYYEADAIARFLGARLPTEAEWELSARECQVSGNFVESEALRALPAPRESGRAPQQLFGDAWEWTASSYAPYPGYRQSPGALGEYNGKFMVNQMVLRGGSCLTPEAHIRASYRNFWPAATRFQVTGIRLARSLGPSLARPRARFDQ